MFLPVKPVELINGFLLKLGKKHYHFREAATPFNNISSSGIVADKYCANKLLEMAGIPVPKAVFLQIEEYKQGNLEEKIRDLKFPLVIKPPFNSARGAGVLCNIQTLEQLHYFLEQHFLSDDYVLIEEFHGKLKSWRVLVFNKKVIGVLLRHPAAVVGDGQHTISELIDLENIKRKKISDALGPIALDDECHIRLKELGLTPEYIPHAQEQVVLAYTSNATRGGIYESFSKNMCKENRRLMIRVASLLNLNLTGIDVECADIINTPLTQSNGVIIEVNQTPSIRIHELPIKGNPQLVTRKIMRSFIYRHPLAYLHALYSNKPTASYVRAFILASILVIIYLFIM